jgi:hypothetical protein
VAVRKEYKSTASTGTSWKDTEASRSKRFELAGVAGRAILPAKASAATGSSGDNRSASAANKKSVLAISKEVNRRHQSRFEEFEARVLTSIKQEWVTLVPQHSTTRRGAI